MKIFVTFLSKFLKPVFDKLDGKKTYLGAAGLFIAGGLLATNVIDQETFAAIVAVVGGWTAYGIKDAVKKIK